MLEVNKVNLGSSLILIDKNITDIMKFVACIMVAMSHYSGYALSNGVSSSIIYRLFAAMGGYLGVAIFFFLSGYGLMKSNMCHPLRITDFLRKRLIRTWGPAILVSFIWLVIAFLCDRSLLCNQRYLEGIIWWFNDEVMWFVRVILILYIFFLLYWILIIILPSSYNYKLFLIFVLGGLAYWIVRITGIGSSLSVPLFFIGMVVADSPIFLKRICSSIYCISFLSVLFLCIIWLCRDNNYLIHGCINYFCVGLVIVFFFEF